MMEQTVTDRIRTHTEAIQAAREALQRNATREARERLRSAELAYRAFLLTLNGIPG